MRFGTVEFQVVSFMRLRCAILFPACALAPGLRDAFDDPAYRFGVMVVWSEIPASRIVRSVRKQFFSQCQVTGERFQHMLPRACRSGVGDQAGSAAPYRAPHVGNQPVLPPTATADDIAGAGTGKGNTMFGVGCGIEKGISV